MRVMRLRTAKLVCALMFAGVTATAASTAAPVNSLTGSISYGSFTSKALRGTMHYSVYLPAGYTTSKRYPVIYFLHGLPATADAYRAIGPITAAVQQSGYQAIVVGVQGARAGDADPEWRNWGAGRNWETATAKELVSVIDARYSTIGDRSGRVLVGISAGGYGATLIALHNPGVYAAVESWSGYFHATNEAGTAALDLGSDAVNAWANAHRQISNVRRLLSYSLPRTYFAFYVGSSDSRFRAENVEFYNELRSAGISRIVFRIYPGAHDWTLWSAHGTSWIRNALIVAAKPARA